MGFEIVRLDHVQLAMPAGPGSGGRSLLLGAPRVGPPPQARAPGGAGRLLVRRRARGRCTSASRRTSARPARRIRRWWSATCPPSRRPWPRPGWRCGRTPTPRPAAVPMSTTRSATGSSSSRGLTGHGPVGMRLGPAKAAAASGQRSSRSRERVDERGRRRQGRGGPSPPASPVGEGTPAPWRERELRTTGVRRPVCASNLGGTLALHKNQRQKRVTGRPGGSAMTLGAGLDGAGHRGQAHASCGPRHPGRSRPRWSRPRP